MKHLTQTTIKCLKNTYILFFDKLVVQGPKRDLIIALLEVYIGEKAIFLNKKTPSCISSVEITLK